MMIRYLSMKRSFFIRILICQLSLLFQYTLIQAQEGASIQAQEGASIQAQEEASASVENSGWKAGTAKTVITPPEDMWMAGYAARDKPSEGKLHDLWAKAMALQDAGGNRILLITTDIIGVDRDLSVSICNRLGEVYGLSRKNIVLSCSHTHSGPVINHNLALAYPPFDESQVKQIENNRSFISEQIIAVAGRAINNLEPVRLSSGVGIARFAVNRRENRWNDEMLYSPDLKGPSDHVVQVIRVSDPTDLPVALLFGYSCHATTLMINQWSGDYPGFAQIELEKSYPGLTAMFFAGFGADQNPMPRREISLAEQYGKELAIAVEQVIKQPMRQLTPSIQTIYNEIELELSSPPTAEELENILDDGADWEKRWAALMKEKTASGERFPLSYPNYPIQSWQLGEQSLVVLGGEVVVDYAFALRDTLGTDLMLMGYANDVMTYIPSERILSEGGYEGKTAMWVYGHHGTWLPGIEEKIVNEVVRQVKQIRDGEPVEIGKQVQTGSFH